MTIYDEDGVRFAEHDWGSRIHRVALHAEHLPPPCPACNQPFEPGDHVALVALGPGRDPDGRKRARSWPTLQCGRSARALGLCYRR